MEKCLFMETGFEGFGRRLTTRVAKEENVS